MALTAPIVGTYTLPIPTSYSADTVMLGAVATMADGSRIVDLLNASNRALAIYKFEWAAATDSEATNIENGYWTHIANSPLSFTNIDGNVISAQPSEKLGVTKQAVRVAGNNLRWRMAFELMEAP